MNERYFYEPPSSLGNNQASLLLLSLLGALYSIISSYSCSVFLYGIKNLDWPSISFLFRMTVRTCFSCTTISVYGIMSKNYFSSCLRDSLDTPAGALVSRLRVQRYNNSANHQNITPTFFKKINPKYTIPYNNLCARIEITHTESPTPLQNS